MKVLRWGIVCAGVFLCVGCNAVQPKAQTPYGHYYLDNHGNFSSVDRVVLLELDNQSNRVELPSQLTKGMADGLGKKHLFSIRTIDHTDPLWSRLNLDEISISSNTFQSGRPRPESWPGRSHWLCPIRDTDFGPSRHERSKRQVFGELRA